MNPKRFFLRCINFVIYSGSVLFLTFIGFCITIVIFALVTPLNDHVGWAILVILSSIVPSVFLTKMLANFCRKKQLPPQDDTTTFISGNVPWNNTRTVSQMPPKRKTFAQTSRDQSKMFPVSAIGAGKKAQSKPIHISDALLLILVLFIAFYLSYHITLSLEGFNGSTGIFTMQNPDTIIYDDSDITIYTSEIHYGSDQATVKILVENKTNENIGFYCSSFVVDNVMMDSILWMDIANGAKAAKTLYLDNTVLQNAGFDRISHIEFYQPHISFTESNRNAKYISVGCTFANDTASASDQSGEVLYSKNGVTVISRFSSGNESSKIPLLIINESGKDITPLTSHVTVNGYTVSEWHYGVVIKDNTSRYFDIQLVKESLEETGVSSINTASFNLSFLAAGSTKELFSAGQLHVQ